MTPEVEKRVQMWLNGPIDTESKAEIFTLMKSDPQALSHAFSAPLSFGTGGMRSLMGIGTNRLNRYTIRFAAQGLAQYLLKQHPIREQHSVFISYDTRHHSKEFALEAARVLAGNGIGAYVTLEFRPTPYVSFGVRQKECSLGIMITASHNSKEYNGLKVYGRDGGQLAGDLEREIGLEIEKISDFDQVHLAAENSPLIEIVDLEFDEEYLDAIAKLQIDSKEDHLVGDHLKITYTPLHGTGFKLIPKALARWGFTNIHPVDPQLVPDGDFPTVKKPNPEDPEALNMGLVQLENTLSDILIASDPDADRMAVAVMHRDKPYLLNGNQIAVLCLEYLCRMGPPPRSAAVTTIVSTDLFEKICNHYKIECFKVLTGFKYIGELIHKWELDQSHHFLFGAEESYGYLFGTHSRDKDAVSASCLICEIALLMKVEGRTLVDFLNEIYKTHGLFWEGQRALEMERGKIESIMKNLRVDLPKQLFRQTVEVIDYLQKSPSADVLLFQLADKSKVIIRPSGTEPKLKIYAGVYQPDFTTVERGIEACKEKIQRLLDEIQALF